MLKKDYLGMLRVIILLAFAGVTYFMVSVYMMNHFIVINDIKQKYTPISIIFMTTLATIPAIILPPFIGSLCDKSEESHYYFYYADNSNAFLFLYFK